MLVDMKQWALTNNTDNLWREEYFTLGKIKVPEFFNIKFSFNMSYFLSSLFFNSFYFDMAIKPYFKAQNIALITLSHSQKKKISWKLP